MKIDIIQTITKMLELYVSRNNSCYIKDYNYIKIISETEYKISVIETDKCDNIFVSVYNIFINDDEFRIMEE